MKSSPCVGEHSVWCRKIRLQLIIMLQPKRDGERERYSILSTGFRTLSLEF